MKEKNSFSSQKLSKSSKLKLTNTDSFASITSNFSTNEKEDSSSLMKDIIKKIENYQIQNEAKLKDEEISYQIKNNLYEINKKIYNILDDKRNTFLHILVKNSNYYPLKIICDTYYILSDNENLFFKWFLFENSDKLTALDIASMKGNKKILSYLYSILGKTNKSWLKLDDINHKSNTIFHHSAIKNQFYSIIFWYEKLQKHFPKTKIFDTKNQHNLTPLHCACFENSYECVQLLIDLGADTNAVDIDGKSVLTYAIKSNNIKIIELLLLNGADCNKKDSEGKKPYDYSIDECDKNIQSLLYKKTNFNSIISNKNRFEIIQLLLMHLFFILLLISRFLDVEDFESLFIKKHIYISFIFLGISFLFSIISLLFISYFSCCIKHKQHIKRKKQTLLKLYDKYNTDICAKCLRRKKEKTYHCVYCNLCIDDWKFHSFWLNTCITKENILKYKIFIISVIILLVNIIISIIIIESYALLDKKEYKKNNNIFNNFFYLYDDGTKNQNYEGRNKKIKNYIFIPFLINCIILYIIILIRIVFKFIKKKKEKQNIYNVHHNINSLKIGLVYDEDEDNNNGGNYSSVAASIGD